MLSDKTHSKFDSLLKLSILALTLSLSPLNAYADGYETISGTFRIPDYCQSFKDIVAFCAEKAIQGCRDLAKDRGEDFGFVDNVGTHANYINNTVTCEVECELRSYDGA